MVTDIEDKTKAAEWPESAAEGRVTSDAEDKAKAAEWPESAAEGRVTDAEDKAKAAEWPESAAEGRVTDVEDKAKAAEPESAAEGSVTESAAGGPVTDVEKKAKAAESESAAEAPQAMQVDERPQAGSTPGPSTREEGKRPSDAEDDAGPAKTPRLSEEEAEDYDPGLSRVKLSELMSSLDALQACLRHFNAKATPPATPRSGMSGAGSEVDNPLEVDYGTDSEAEEEQGGDDEKGDAAEAEPLDPEQMARLMSLVQDQKKLLEDLVNRPAASPVQEADQVATLLLADIMDNRLEAAKGRVESMRRDQLAAVADFAGLTPLHHAVRTFDVDLVFGILSKAPSLADAVSLPNHQPGRWTALMVIANIGIPKADEQKMRQEIRITALLVSYMSREALTIRGSNYVTCLHLAASRGKLHLVKKILYRLNELGGEDAVRAFTAMENTQARTGQFMFFCGIFLLKDLNLNLL
jgi:hypothetical protein